MKIRKSRPEDLGVIMNIYAGARRFMADNGNYVQWGPTNWPPEELVKSDIAAGKSYVCVEDEGEGADASARGGGADAGAIHGVFYYDYGKDIDATYDVIEDGAWLSDSAYGVVHRIATDRTPGVGTFCINWAYEQCGHIRMDTHASNIPMNKLLRKLGFSFTGIIHVVEDDYPRNAYEKI